MASRHLSALGGGVTSLPVAAGGGKELVDRLPPRWFAGGVCVDTIPGKELLMFAAVPAASLKCRAILLFSSFSVSTPSSSSVDTPSLLAPSCVVPDCVITTDELEDAPLGGASASRYTVHAFVKSSCQTSEMNTRRICDMRLTRNFALCLS